MLKRVEVKLNNAGIKDYIERELGFSSRSVKRLLKEKKIFLNGKAAYWDNVLKVGDILEIDMEEKGGSNIEPENIPIEIIYEDNELLVVNKPPFMVMHPTRCTVGHTLANAIAYHFKVKGENLPIRFLNRLDMNTSGVVVIPKSSIAHSRLSRQMEENQIVKKYIAVISGSLLPECGTIDAPIGKVEDNDYKRMVTAEGQHAVTLYKTLRRLKSYSILELRLLTGRTHQIRVHLSHKGHPIVGDTLYSGVSDFIARQALHAVTIELRHPITDETMFFNTSLPEDMEELISKLDRDE